MRTSFLVECLLRVLNRRVAVAKDASPRQKQALNKLDASSMETTRIREPQGPLVASSLRSERYSPGPLRLSNARSFLDSTSNLYILAVSVSCVRCILRRGFSARAKCNEQDSGKKNFHYNTIEEVAYTIC